MGSEQLLRKKLEQEKTSFEEEVFFLKDQLKEVSTRDSILDEILDFLPRQKNSWVVFGTGKAPSV
jgi:hypothetical protein